MLELFRRAPRAGELSRIVLAEHEMRAGGGGKFSSGARGPGTRMND